MPDTSHTKYLLTEDEMPRAWYNIMPDLPRPPEPFLHPGTKQPVTPDDLAPLFPMALIMQEVSTERYIEIPEPVRQVYTLWRPSPLFRARRLEKALDQRYGPRPAMIFCSSRYKTLPGNIASPPDRRLRIADNAPSPSPITTKSTNGKRVRVSRAIAPK